MPGPDPAFWQERFATHTTPWDRGAASPQLDTWIAQGLFARGARVAVPGCGVGHELPALAAAGCRVSAIDYTAAAVQAARERLDAAGVRAVEVIQADVLAWQPDAPLDAVYEQTCLCALYPDHWRDYADRLHRWLRPGATLAALFMQARREGAGLGRIEGPPYHCDINAMRALFAQPHWQWPAPPYAQVPHPSGLSELAVVLVRR